MSHRFYLPTQIISGFGCVKQNTELFKKLGTRAFIATYPVARTNHSLDDILCVLDQNDMATMIFEECEPNPSTEQVERMGKMARDFNCDLVIGIGGGSALDAAKAVAVLGANEIMADDLYTGNYQKILPLITVPTTAGTGAEVTFNAVLTNTDKNGKKTKKSFADERLFPKYAFLDATYTIEMPLEITRETAIDALTHAIEGFLSSKATPIGELFAKEGIRIFSQNYDALCAGKITPQQRQQLLLAACYSGIVIAQERTLAPHAMSYALTTHRNISHGRATGLLIAAFVEQAYKTKNAQRKVEEILDSLNIAGILDLFGYIDELISNNTSFSEKELRSYAEETWQTAAAKPNPCDMDESLVFEMYKRSLIRG